MKTILTYEEASKEIEKASKEMREIYKEFPSIPSPAVEDIEKEVEKTIAKIAKIEWKESNQTAPALVPSVEDLHRFIHAPQQILGELLKEMNTIVDIWKAEQDLTQQERHILVGANMISTMGMLVSKDFDSAAMSLVWQLIPWRLPVPQVPQEILESERLAPATNFAICAFISHSLWQYTRDYLIEKYGKEKVDIPPHPLKTAIRTWQQEQTAKPVTAEYDRKYPVAVLTHSMASVRELAFTENDVGEVFKTPARVDQIQQMELELGCDASVLPRIMPLQVVRTAGLKPQTKSGAVSHELRIFFEAMMALQPNQHRADLMFRLGDLIDFLYPNGKFHWTNQMPHIERALGVLHTYATVPWIDDQGSLREWRPVAVRAPLIDRATRETPIYIEVQMPPDARRGHIVIKNVHRHISMKSAAQWNAYHIAAYLWDKHGTVKGKLVDPTRPIETRDEHNSLVDATGNPLLTRNGKAINSPYHPEAVRQLEREPNTDAIQRYPVLSNEDLIQACYPNGYRVKSRREYLQRAKAHWQRLEDGGYIVIHKGKNGWRILPSAEHLNAHRALRKASKGVY